MHLKRVSLESQSLAKGHLEMRSKESTILVCFNDKPRTKFREIPHRASGNSTWGNCQKSVLCWPTQRVASANGPRHDAYISLFCHDFYKVFSAISPHQNIKPTKRKQIFLLFILYFSILFCNFAGQIITNLWLWYRANKTSRRLIATTRTPYAGLWMQSLWSF